MPMTLPPYLAHRHSVWPGLGVAVGYFETVPTSTRPAIYGRDAFLLGRGLMPTPLRCDYSLQKSGVQHGLSPLALPFPTCTGASASPPPVVSRWCQYASTPATRQIPIPLILLIYAESEMVADGSRTRNLQSHNPPTPISRRCHTSQNSLI